MFLAEKGLTIPVITVDLMKAREPQAALHRAQSRRPAARARTRQRQVYRRDRRDLGIPRRETPQPAADWRDRRGSRRDAAMAAPRRAEYHRESLQRVPLRRRTRAVQESRAVRARGGAGPETDHAGATQVARRPDRTAATLSCRTASRSRISSSTARSILRPALGQKIDPSLANVERLVQADRRTSRAPSRACIPPPRKSK